MPQKHTRKVLATEIAHKVRCECPKCGKNMNVPQELVLDIINTYFVELALALREESTIQARGLGTFQVQDMPSKRWNPKTQELQEFGPAKRIRCKIAQSFLAIVTGKDDPYADLNPDMKMVAPNPDVAANFDAQTQMEKG